MSFLDYCINTVKRWDAEVFGRDGAPDVTRGNILDILGDYGRSPRPVAKTARDLANALRATGELDRPQKPATQQFTRCRHIALDLETSEVVATGFNAVSAKQQSAEVELLTAPAGMVYVVKGSRLITLTAEEG